MREVNICPICQSTKLNMARSCKDFTTSHETFSLKECTSCHFLITSPSPDIDQLARYYNSDHYVSHTSRANSIINIIYLLVRSYTLRSKLYLVNQHTTGSHSKTLLDYGCGTGQFLKVCSSSGWKITGVEPSPEARKLAIANCKESILSSIEELPTNKQYTVITLWHVLEHVPKLNETIAALRDKLEDTGRLIVALPNRESWDARHYQDQWAGYDVPRHLWHFSQNNIQTLLKNHGLTIAAKVPMPFDAYYVSLLSEKYKQNNQTTLSGITKAILNGLRSNHRAKKDNQYSSIIYIAKK